MFDIGHEFPIFDSSVQIWKFVPVFKKLVSEFRRKCPILDTCAWSGTLVYDFEQQCPILDTSNQCYTFLIFFLILDIDVRRYT